MISNLNLKSTAVYSALLIAVLISWFPVITVSFLNDDYQILGYQLNSDFPDQLKAFSTPGVYYHYWRPVPDFIHGLTLNIAGFNPLAFRIAGLLIYLFACIQVFRSLKAAGVDDKSSLLSAVLFAVLPSHALQAAWIADQLESLVLSFLLLSFMNYLKAYRIEEQKRQHKYLLFSGLWFAAAVITKEVSYIGVLIPAVYMIYENDYRKNSLIRAAKHIIIGLMILMTLFLYRMIVIGGTPFSSGHFDNISIPGMLINFFIYIPLAFFPPELLELIYSELLLVLIIFFLCSGLIYIIFKHFKALPAEKKNLVTAGAAWFIIFIIPALPVLMRWYVFTASAGLLWITAAFIGKFHSNKIFYAVYAFIILGACYYNIVSMFDWAEAGNKMDIALESAADLKEEISSDTLYVWCTPDKYKRVPMMKLGIQQSLEWSLRRSFNTGIEVYAPLRSELIDEESRIYLIERSDATIAFRLVKGRFLEKGGESKSVIEEEELFYKTDAFDLSIKTMNNNPDIPESAAHIRLFKDIPGDHLYFDGEKFAILRKPE